MDPLTALGLASNIVQFVDFACKLISSAHSLYGSSSGARPEHLEVENLANILRGLADSATPPPQGARKVSDEDSTFLELGRMCRDVSDELLSVLQSVKVKGSHKGFQSFYQALRSEWKQKEISALQTRLDRIGNMLNTKILSQLWIKLSRALEALDARNSQLEAARASDIHLLSKDIKERFGDLEKALMEMHEEKSMSDSLAQLSLSAQQGRRYSTEQQILDFLLFDGMEDRHANIRPAHEKTFPWVFERSTSTTNGRTASEFTEWIVSEDSLYWISGKPGSGKSTLMKYIWNHDLTLMNLKQWAGASRLVVAKFFFWTASRTELPKSQEGLLRSILYQILRQCPDLIPQVFPRQWHAYTSRNLDLLQARQDDLQLPELLGAFQRVSSLLATNNVKFCFFIDGLDEYSGKPNEIIPLVKIFSSSSRIKICVSSRPWNEFEKVFGQIRSRKLYMEEFNRPDIERYVRDTLEKDATYQELQEVEDNTPDLVQEVVEAASGVFLWVYLVVQSLLDGLTNEDSISDLQRRLRQLPKTLKEYFKSIFNNIDEFYMEQTAHMFLVTLAAHNTLPLLSYWFIDQKDNYVLELAIQPLSMQKTNFRLKQMRKRLNACCKGLLEVQFYDDDESDNASLSSSVLFQWKVDFLHRTVRDFLNEEDMQHLLTNWARSDYNSDEMICEIVLAHIKISPPEAEYLEYNGPIEKLIAIFQRHECSLQQNALKLSRAKVLRDELINTMNCNGGWTSTSGGIDWSYDKIFLDSS